MRISDLSSDVCSSDLLQPRIAFSDYGNHHRYLPADLSCINSGANMGTTAIIVLVILAITIIYGIGIYNRLITLRNRYKNSFAQIEVQLKRRYDLIPNLVETAKGYLTHERETLEAVVAARDTAAKGD